MDETDNMNNPGQNATIHFQEQCNKWRIKFKTLIHTDVYCCICLEDAENSLDINSYVLIHELEPDYEKSLLHILYSLFGDDASKYVAGDLICAECIDKAINAYVFIENSKRTSRILLTSISNIIDNVDYTLNNIDNLEFYEKSEIYINLEEIMNVNTVESKKIVDRNAVNKVVKNMKNDVYKKNNFECTTCKRNFASSDALNKHKDVHKPVVTDKTDGNEANNKANEESNGLSITQCQICNTPFLNTDLNDHIKTHKQTKWFCTVCDKFYYSINSFNTHIREKHDKTNVFNCDFCLKTFFDKDIFQGHKCKYRCTECIEIPCPHHKYLLNYMNQKEAGLYIVKCVDCTYECNRKISTISHANVHHLERFNNVCQICGQSFQSKPALTQHRLKFHKKQLCCKNCQRNFSSEAMLEKHESMCEIENFKFDTFKCLRKKKDISCNSCLMSFSTKENLDKHNEDAHKIVISCTKCLEDFDCNEKYTNHLANHAPGTKHICRVCNATFNSRINHRNHVKAHAVTSEKRICPYCSRAVSSTYLSKHISRHRKEKGLGQVQNKKKIGKYKCELCSKLFVTKFILKRHYETHKDHEQCQLCKKYVKPSNMQSHVENHNFEKQGIVRKNWMKKTFECSKCNYVTHFPACFEAHQNKVHLKIRPYVCHVCNKDFHSRNMLGEHVKTHNKDTNRKLCKICGNNFANSQCLKKHMRIHTGERPYPCNECEKKFMSASCRQAHVIRKHSKPDIACPICKNIYHTVRDVRTHIKKVHCRIKQTDNNSLTMDDILNSDDHKYIFKDHRRSD